MQGHWLNQVRLTVYPRIFIGLYLIAGGIWISMSHHRLDPYYKPRLRLHHVLGGVASGTVR
ncbi:MAG: hypothetical protein JWR07_1588 [Nevskia sp.]|nr:hypothetical protein [Nevskia sp.]